MIMELSLDLQLLSQIIFSGMTVKQIIELYKSSLSFRCIFCGYDLWSEWDGAAFKNRFCLLLELFMIPLLCNQASKFFSFLDFNSSFLNNFFGIRWLNLKFYF